MKKVIIYLVLSVMTALILCLGVLLARTEWQDLVISTVSMACVILCYFLIIRHKEARESRWTSQTIAKYAFENTALGMCVANLDLKYLAINNSYCEIIGYSKDELISMTHKEFVHPDDRFIDEPYVKQLLAGQELSFETTKRYIHKLGHVVWGRATVSLVRDEAGKPKWFVTQIQDITTLVEAQNRLTNMARSDYLTGSLNRRAFMEKLNEEVSRSKREGTSLSIILLDIDHFKKINDTYGHLAGDHVLQMFSECLRDNCRPYDFIGRYGGEEFIVGLPNTEMNVTTEIAERLRQRIETLCLTNANYPLTYITCSLGVATLNNQKIEDVDALISRADNALYEAKRVRNIVCSA